MIKIFFHPYKYSTEIFRQKKAKQTNKKNNNKKKIKKLIKIKQMSGKTISRPLTKDK